MPELRMARKSSIILNNSAIYDMSGIKDNLSLKVYVPEEQVGRVIGKKGSTIQHLKSETDTNISLLPKQEASLWHPIGIRGEFVRVKSAFGMLVTLVDEVDDVIMEFPLPKAKCAYLQNAKVVIPLISASTKTRVHIPDSNYELKFLTVQLEGSFESVCKALDMLLDAAFNPQEKNTGVLTTKREQSREQSSESAPRPVKLPVSSGVEDSVDNRSKAAPTQKDNKTQEAFTESAVNNSGSAPDKQSVYIPQKIIGLLLVRNQMSRGKPPKPVNVLSLIQRYTSTVILKDGAPPRPPAGVAAEEGIAEETKEAHVEAAAVGVEEIAKKSVLEVEEGEGAAGEEDMLLYWVSGDRAARIALAADSLNRIVAGDRINAVVRDLEEFSFSQRRGNKPARQTGGRGFTRDRKFDAGDVKVDTSADAAQTEEAEEAAEAVGAEIGDWRRQGRAEDTTASERGRGGRGYTRGGGGGRRGEAGRFGGRGFFRGRETHPRGPRAGSTDAAPADA